MSESLTDIARKLNVAPSTISRALSSPEKVAPKTREKILNYVAQTGYRPNLSARNLRMQRSNTIGIVVNDLCDSLISKAANIMQDVASKRGYFPVVLSSDESRTKERESINSLLMSNVCGLVIIPSSATASLLDKLTKIPVVELDRSTDTNLNDEFRMDDKAAMQMATSYLIKNGCRHIAVMLGNINRISSFKSRYLALMQCSKEVTYSPFFIKGVTAHDLCNSARYLTNCIIKTQGKNAIKLIPPQEETTVTPVNANTAPATAPTASTTTTAATSDCSGSTGCNGSAGAYSTGYDASCYQDNGKFQSDPEHQPWLQPLSQDCLNSLLLPESSDIACNQDLPIDGIIAANNSIAAGIVQGFYDTKQEVGKNIKVFTFDNPDWLAVLPYSIPSITHPLNKAAYLAINRLIDRIEHKYTETVEARLLRPQLIAPDERP